MENNIKLDKKNEKIFKISVFLIFAIFILGSLYFSYRLFFPSLYFQQSFENMNSLRNTITDVSRSENSVSFFSSTPQDFSEIKAEIELEKTSDSMENLQISAKKSYKSFFYPESLPAEALPEENILAASPESIFLISKDKKYPFDNPLTFEGLGYEWKNIGSEEVDLSEYEKAGLLNISSAHPDGTVFASDSGNYYLTENGQKKRIDISDFPQVKDFKNNIYAEESSLEIYESCKLEKSFIFRRKYSCVIPVEKIIGFLGKDYKFELSGIPEGADLKKIDLEFKKTASQKNLFIFLSDVKNKIRARFTGEQL